MSVLRSIESKIADLVEGAFGRAFRSEITPVELSRRLVREMDRHRQSSLSSTVVPNEYVVWLSSADRRHFAAVEGSLLDELAAHLLEHARSERLALPSRPRIELRTDPRLSLGECAIEASLSNAPSPPVARRYGVPPPADRTSYRPEPAPPRPLVGEVLSSAWLDVDGQQVPIGAGGLLIGRSSDADIVIPAQEVSRRHAEIRAQEGGWTLVDLNSTNGVRLNRRPLTVPARLHQGDVIEIGSVELVFEVG
jgi:predicted component of type VI protein secretion system